jgi:hypothetical protein
MKVTLIYLLTIPLFILFVFPGILCGAIYTFFGTGFMWGVEVVGNAALFMIGRKGP